MANEKEQVKRLTPIDIHDQEFKKRGRHGYDRFEVDSFLDKIVDDYGDTLDENNDLKNQIYSLQQQNKKLTAIANEYQGQKQQITAAQELIKKAQQEANEKMAAAEKEIAQHRQEAQHQAQIDLDYEKQQQDTIQYDYERLKEQVAEFRKHIQGQLQAEIVRLNDEDWQKELDKYFHTERFYTETGEPVAMVDPDDKDAEDEEVDNEGSDEVDSGEEIEEPDEDADGEGSQVMTGDSSQQATVARKRPEAKSAGATIVFPDDYNEHN